ncbi:MAG: hypothetical protein ACOYKA_03665 [Legionellaceae bacterium]
MKKTSLAVAALLTTLSAATLVPVAYAEASMDTNTTMCQGCKGCKGCMGCKGCKGCMGCKGCKGCKGCAGCSGS